MPVFRVVTIFTCRYLLPSRRSICTGTVWAVPALPGTQSLSTTSCGFIMKNFMQRASLLTPRGAPRVCCPCAANETFWFSACRNGTESCCAPPTIRDGLLQRLLLRPSIPLHKGRPRCAASQQTHRPQPNPATSFHGTVDGSAHGDLTASVGAGTLET